MPTPFRNCQNDKCSVQVHDMLLLLIPPLYSFSFAQPTKLTFGLLPYFHDKRKLTITMTDSSYSSTTQKHTSSTPAYPPYIHICNAFNRIQTTQDTQLVYFMRESINNKNNIFYYNERGKKVLPIPRCIWSCLNQVFALQSFYSYQLSLATATATTNSKMPTVLDCHEP